VEVQFRSGPHSGGLRITGWRSAGRTVSGKETDEKTISHHGPFSAVGTLPGAGRRAAKPRLTRRAIEGLEQCGHWVSIALFVELGQRT